MNADRKHRIEKLQKRFGELMAEIQRESQTLHEEGTSSMSYAKFMRWIDDTTRHSGDSSVIKLRYLVEEAAAIQFTIRLNKGVFESWTDEEMTYEEGAKLAKAINATLDACNLSIKHPTLGIGCVLYALRRGETGVRFVLEDVIDRKRESIALTKDEGWLDLTPTVMVSGDFATTWFNSIKRKVHDE